MSGFQPFPLSSRGQADETLESAFNPRSNSLGFLRYLLAALVVFDHAFPIGGFHHGRDPMLDWSRGQETFGGFAVAGFFVISGYLIARSFASSPSVPNFLWRRCLRLMPAFWVCLVVTAFVFAPIAWHHEIGPFHSFWSGHRDSPIRYLHRNALLTIHQWNIDGLLAGTPYSKTGFANAFNGSLWTLIYEFKCYLGVAVLGWFGLVKRGRSVFLGLAVFLWVVQLGDLMVPGSAKRASSLFADPQLIRLPLLFLIGTLLYLYRDRIIISNRFAVLAALTIIVSFRTGTYSGLGVIGLAYLCFWLAIRLPLQRFDAKGDFSYGLYVYAFPVEQMLALYRFYRFGLVAFVAASLVITTALAVLSWKLIEAPCLRLKSLRLSRFTSIGQHIWPWSGRVAAEPAVVQPDSPAA